MAVFFGTDGIRGIANSSLSHDIAFKCGNALTMLKDKPVVVMCKDTRVSGDMIISAMSAGIMCGGGKVINCGILPTAGLAYITREYSADYGVVISASHNPFEYNGIKIFSSQGYKLTEDREEEIEELFNKINLKSGKEIGTCENDLRAREIYSSYLAGTVRGGLNGLKIVLDCACGAAYSIAPEVFSKFGCTLIARHTDIEKGTINENCGSMHPEALQREVTECGADMGFAFDGDSDRVIACDEKGKLVDGDCLIYMLSKQMKSDGRLSGDSVVGTSHTNMGIQKSLAESGIRLFRADIGDKYVREMMTVKNCSLGGEQSGHVIIGDLSTTGDGILTALQVAQLIKTSGKSFSELNDAKLYPQVNINVNVKDKLLVLNSEHLQEAIENSKKTLLDSGRVMVRASGTEPKIRIMAESESIERAQDVANYLKTVIKAIAEGTQA